MPPWERGALVEVLDLVTLASLGVVEFESCASQKCCVMMWIALTCPRVPHDININSGFKWAGSMITHVRSFFWFIKKKKKRITLK